MCKSPQFKPLMPHACPGTVTAAQTHPLVEYLMSVSTEHSEAQNTVRHEEPCGVNRRTTHDREEAARGQRRCQRRSQTQAMVLLHCSRPHRVTNAQEKGPVTLHKRSTTKKRKPQIQAMVLLLTSTQSHKPCHLPRQQWTLLASRQGQRTDARTPTVEATPTGLRALLFLCGPCLCPAFWPPPQVSRSGGRPCVSRTNQGSQHKE